MSPSTGLTAEERHTLLVDWNDTAAPYPRDRCLHQLIEEQAQRTPGAVAIRDGTTSLTYAEFDHRANQLASHLRDLGVEPGSLVGVCLERSTDLVVSLVAVLKAGGAYVPLDPALPAARLGQMLADAEPSVTVSRTGLLTRLTDTSGWVVCLDRDWSSITASASSLEPAVVNPDSPAYLLYTSGSTGRPKGVLVSHRGVVNYLWWAVTAYRVDEADAVPVFTSIAFDLTVTSVFAALLVGRTVDVLPDDHGPAALAHRLMGASSSYSILMVSPAHLTILEHECGPAGAGHLARSLIVGGEQLYAESLAFWRRHAPTTRIINEYGPTETVVASCSYRVPDDFPATGPVPIGRPIANTTVYLLDDAANLVPIGAIGELYIGGDGVGLGYWRQPELTAERFLPDPFSTRPPARLYRTGDLARWRPDGNLEFVGRRDDQIQLRGFRIELGDVEAALMASPAVREAAVRLHGGDGVEPTLIGYLVAADPTKPIDLPAYRDALATRVPSYMIPGSWVVLDRLPRFPHGKVDRGALPLPVSAPPAQPSALDPATHIVAAIVRDLFGRDLALNEDFFRAGGHSLLATRLAARLSRTTGRHVPVAMVFANPTIATLAAAVGCQPDDPLAEPLAAMPDRSDWAPLSGAQRRMWLLSQMDRASPLYHVPMAWRLEGEVDPRALKRAWHAVVARHESLRTRFRLGEGGPQQHVVTDPVPIGDLVIAPHDLQAVLETEVVAPFDLEARGPVRATLIRTADDDHVLLVTVHHIAFDAWSGPVLERELSAAYAMALHGPEPSLGTLPIHVADHAIWERGPGAGAAVDLPYWLEQLANLAPTRLLGDRPGRRHGPRAGRHHRVALDAELARDLGDLARDLGMTLYQVLLTGFAAILHRYTGDDEISVGAPVAGRDQPALEGLIGCFINTVVWRIDLDGAPSGRELLDRVRATVLAGLAHPNAPFDAVVDALAPSRGLGSQPLFSILFSLRAEPATSELRLAGVKVEPIEVAPPGSKFDLTLEIVARGNHLTADWEFDTDRFDAATISGLADRYLQVLRHLCHDRDRPIEQWSLAGTVEEAATAERSPAADPRPARPPSLLQLFAARVEESPDAPAVLDGTTATSYRELDRVSNRIAAALIDAGAGPGDRVGLLLPRSLDFVAAALGILKSGAGYLPLDADQPPSRTHQLLDHAAARVLVTNRGQLPVALDGRLIVLEDIPVQTPPVLVLPPERDDDVAYVMYTSGSTGEPKGVVVSRRSVVHLAWRPSFVGIDSASVIGFLSNVAFDAATFEIWGALLNGAALRVIPPDDATSPAGLAAAFQTGGVTCAFLTTALFQRVAAAAPDAFATLDTVLFGGERCDPDRVALALEANGPKRLVHVYGPTETTTFATAHPVTRADCRGVTVPIGRAIGGGRVDLRDHLGRPVPEGMPGEIVVAGPGVALGYWPLSASNREGPFAIAADGTREYRTGDLARRRPDGALEFLGRRDRQLKLRGFRIEPEEVQQALNRHPSVLESFVALRTLPNGEPGLVGYIRPRPGMPAPEPAALRGYLATLLPRFLIPTAFQPVAEIPLTKNGKVNPMALPSPTPAALIGEAGYRAPRSAIEEAVCAIWERALGVPRVGIDDNFFDLGGHSLLAATVFAELDPLFERRLTLGSLLEAPTVRELTARFSAAHVADDRSLVQLAAPGPRLPLFAVPGVMGNVVGFADLARALDGRPFYGLQSVGLDGARHPLRTLPEIAARHIEEIKAIQPAGPYHVLGTCFGAAVAYEIGWQLARAGEQVNLLVLLDPPQRVATQPNGSGGGTSAPSPVGDGLRFAAKRVRISLSALKGRGPVDGFRYLGHKLARLLDLIRRPNIRGESRRDYYQDRVYQANLGALEHYRPRGAPPTIGRILILDTAIDTFGAEYDWRRLAPDRATLAPIPGIDSGDAIKGDNARQLAAILGEALNPPFGEDR